MTTQTDDIVRFYRDTVLHHAQSPHNQGTLEPSDRVASRHNALCGDECSIFLRLAPEGCISDARFTATGCAISIASASIMTDLIRGRTIKDASDLADEFTAYLEHGTAWTAPTTLAAIAEVRAYPARVRCALLPWQALSEALDQPRLGH